MINQPQKDTDFWNSFENINSEDIKGLQTDTNKNLQDAKDNQLGGKNTINVNISIGSQKSKTKSSSSTTIVQGSTVKADGNINITATEKDINIKGSDISGEDVSLAAKGDVNITSAKNTNTSSSDSKASSGSIGVSINTSGISDINAGYSKYKDEVKENGTTHTNSTVRSNKMIGKEIGVLVKQCMFFAIN